MLNFGMPGPRQMFRNWHRAVDAFIHRTKPERPSGQAQGRLDRDQEHPDLGWTFTDHDQHVDPEAERSWMDRAINFHEEYQPRTAHLLRRTNTPEAPQPHTPTPPPRNLNPPRTVNLPGTAGLPGRFFPFEDRYIPLAGYMEHAFEDEVDDLAEDFLVGVDAIMGMRPANWFPWARPPVRDGRVQAERLSPNHVPGASSSAINALPARTIVEGDRDEDGEAMCYVCHDSVPVGTSVTAMRCGHWYHTACLAQWLWHNASCPTCRADIQGNPRPVEEDSDEEYVERAGWDDPRDW
jgi:hypothetical protein